MLPQIMDKAFGNAELVIQTGISVFYENLPLLKSSKVFFFSVILSSKCFYFFKDPVTKKKKTALVFTWLSVFALQSNP